jgi:hypothetical protein
MTVTSGASRPDPGAPSDRIADISDETIDSFAERLGRYADGLSERERRLLDVLVLRSGKPIDRMLVREPSELLDPEEEAILEALLDPPAR